MEQSIQSRRRQFYVDDEDLLARVLGVAEGDYECVPVRSSWPEKGLVEGDTVVIAQGNDALAQSGDIVLIERDATVRLGLLSSPGWLETPVGSRLIEPSETIVGVGVALVRKLGLAST